MLRAGPRSEFQGALARRARGEAPGHALASLVRRVRLLRPAVVPDAVARPRLLEALDRGLTRPLILLSSPPGFGKTTLLGQWLEARALASAWVSLDARAGDLTGFVAHLAAALQAVAPGAAREALAVLGPPRAVPPALLGEILAESLLELEGETVLALDDYHTVTEPGVHELVEALLAHPPPRLHLALATRADPPLPLPRLRAHGQLLELRGADLRFTPEEAGAFLGRALAGRADAAAVALLGARTEGWAAGLRMVTLSLERPAAPAGAGAVAAVLEGRSQGMALDFLLDEVLARQPPAVQDFLLRTSVVDRLCAPLADALLGEAAGDGPPGAGAELLRAVVAANLFITPLEDAGAGRAAEPDDDRPTGGLVWYRYDQLFREVLHERLLTHEGRDAVAALHARASAWFGAQGLLDEAVAHRLAAGDESGAAAFVEGHVQAALDAEAWPAVRRWLDRLPEAAVHGRATLLLARAWAAHGSGRYEAIPPLLAEAQAILLVDGAGAAGTAAHALRGEIDALESLLRFRAGDVPGALARARRALARLPQDRLLARGVAASYLGLGALSLEGPQAAVGQLQALLASPADRTGVFTGHVGTALAFVHLAVGDLHAAARAAVPLVTPSAGAGAEISRAWGHVVQGLVSYEWDDLETARAHYEAALARRHAVTYLIRREATLGLALAQRALGRRGESEAAVGQLLAFLHKTGSPDQLALLQAFQTRLALLEGELEPAARWLRTTPAPLPDAAPAQAVEAVPLTWARALLATGQAGAPGRLREAVTYLEAICRRAAETHHTRREIEALALSALALWAQGLPVAALDALERALALGEPGGFARTFLDLGPPLRALLREAARRRPLSAYAARLLAAAGASAPPGAPAARVSSTEGPAAPARPGGGTERLSQREAEVLGGLARRLSNKEIARELGISVITVKRHAGSIYGKLGAGTRREAVQRAIEAGLLPAG